eukprot:scaffold8511_cov71-Cyclotella_meneghiniana.AAC.2
MTIKATSTNKETPDGSTYPSNLAASLAASNTNLGENFNADANASDSKPSIIFSPNSAPTVDTKNNDFHFADTIFQQMRQHLSFPEGSTQMQQWQQQQQQVQVHLNMTADGRIIPPAGDGIAHIYPRSVSPCPPTNLPNLDGNTWSEFQQRISPISIQIKRALCCFLAYGIITSVLTAVSVFILPHPAFTPLAAVFSFVFFMFIIYVSKGRWNKMNKEMKDICAEFDPKFQMKGHKLEYFENIGLIVLSRLNRENSV